MMCPNCGHSRMTEWTLARQPGKRPYDEWLTHCMRCGALVDKIGGQTNLPAFSQPPEIKELPDKPGRWWMWTGRGDGWYHAIISEEAMRTCAPGHYVQAHTPPPPKPASPAERLRALADALDADDGTRWVHCDELLAIADELEGRDG